MATHSYIGLGFSPGGGMHGAGADIILAWVDTGTVGGERPETGDWIYEPAADEEEKVISVEKTAKMTRDSIVDLIIEKSQQ